ncbi:MAG: hypothetical protein NTV63_04805 [Candidatus Woesearchaeota archaeon]|nr:hypothetical protein [Candidatus Woesearchaeota archaeon]
MPIEELSKVEKRETIEHKSTAEEFIKKCGEATEEISALCAQKKNRGFQIDTIRDVYTPMDRLLEKSLSELDYSAADIETFISSEYHREIADAKRLPLGVCTRITLETLTKKNRAKGEKTVIKIDGSWNEFNYLFFGIQNFDEIYLSNMKGERILSVSDGGKCGTAVLNNIEGSGLCSYLDYNIGSLDNLICNMSKTFYFKDMHRSKPRNIGFALLSDCMVNSDDQFNCCYFREILGEKEPIKEDKEKYEIILELAAKMTDSPIDEIENLSRQIIQIYRSDKEDENIIEKTSKTGYAHFKWLKR